MSISLRARRSRRAVSQYILDLLEGRRLLSGATENAAVEDDCGCADVEEYLETQQTPPTEEHHDHDHDQEGFFLDPNGQRVLFDPLDEPAPEFQLTSRWTSTAHGPTGGEGRGITLTWGIVPDGTIMPAGAGGGTGPSDFRARMNALYGSQAVWQPVIQTMFDSWAAVSGVTYVFEPNDDGIQVDVANPGVLGVRADLRIGARVIDGAFGVLAFNPFPQMGDMTLDSLDLAPGGFMSNTGGNSITLRTTMAHEHGHGLGLLHVCPADGSKLMEPFISTVYNSIPFDDMLGVQRQYGDRYEKGAGNNEIATATDLGNVVVGGPMVEVHQVSTVTSADSDFYKVTLTTGGHLNATITPAGTSYIQGPQTGPCNTGSLFNPSSQGNLILFLRDSTGTVLRLVNATGIGSAESFAAVGLPAGEYYISVIAPGNIIQPYSLRVSATTDNVAPTVTASQFDFEMQQIVQFTFSELVQQSLQPADFSIFNSTTSQTFFPTNLAYNAGTNAVQATFSSILPDGNYVATVAAADVTDGSGNPLAANGVLNFFAFGGDANRDRTADITDFATLSARFNQSGTFSQGNFDYQGLVDIGDFAILTSNFSEILPAPRPAGGASSAQSARNTTVFSGAGSIELTERLDRDFDRIDFDDSGNVTF